MSVPLEWGFRGKKYTHVLLAIKAIHEIFGIILNLPSLFKSIGLLSAATLKAKEAVERLMDDIFLALMGLLKCLINSVSRHTSPPEI